MVTKTDMQILVIEDDERIVSFVRRGLEGEGYRVEWVMTSSAAHEALIQPGSGYDAIIIDWHLGQEDGLELCRAFRSSRIETPILIMSAKDGPHREIERRCVQAGADAFLAKPFAFDKLLSILRELAFSQPTPA